VMSFHQAKGLEFDAVILYGLDARLGGASPITIVEDEAGEPTILPNKDEAALLDSTAERNARARRNLEGELSVLYVGMTRAKRFLDVILPEGKFLRLFEAAYPEAAEVEEYVMEQIGEQLPERGPRYGETSDQKSIASLLAEGSPLLTAHCSLLTTTYRRAAYTTPSGEEGSGTIKTALLLSEEARRARVRGTLVHEWLSRVEWCDALPSADALLAETAKIWEGVIPRERAQEMVEHLFATIADPNSELHSVLTRVTRLHPTASIESTIAEGDPRVAILREHRFAICLDDGGGEHKLVQGSFDRVHLWRDTAGLPVRAEIIDFKTDTIANPAARAAAEAQYAPQLARYAQSLRVLYPSLPQESITTRLCFV